MAAAASSGKGAINCAGLPAHRPPDVMRAPAGTTVQVDLGIDLPRLRPGVPYYLSSHLYAE